MGNNQIKYIVYITTNVVNNKVYIGVHGTEDPYSFDGYLGCGAWINTPSSYNKGQTPLHCAILKYGTANFKRHTLRVFDTVEEALELEKKLVTEDFIKLPTNYNATIGGGMPPKTNKIVYQFDIKGNLIKSWESETAVNLYYNSRVSLSDIINTKRSFAGFFWSFQNQINLSEYTKEIKHGFINQYNLEGVMLNQFKNATTASQKLDLDRYAITSAVFRKKPYSGYYFLKADVDIAEVLSNKFKKTLGKQFIYRYKETGEFDKAYETTSKAVNDTPGAHNSALKNAVVNGYLCGGYRWSYIKSDNYFNIEQPKIQIKVKIAQYTKENELVKVWESIKECKKLYPYCLRVCRGDLKSTQGYIFKYID